MGVWRPALLLAVVIFGLLLFNDQKYLFGTKTVEISDWAADSLMVREAKHTMLLHGHYSRWAFYHPGPALLDTLAAGETLFYDQLHLVPSPYNGQLIALCLIMTLFFSMAMSIFARQLGSGGGGYLFFLPLALFLAVWHYSALEGIHVFLGAWPAEPPVLAFLCFVVAVASVAAGSGWELPVLVIAGGWLVHNHVAQPLFVIPLTLLAYAGLLMSCRKITGETEANPGRINKFYTRGWYQFQRAHWIAVVLLILFILPLVVDALHGGDSNAARILVHLRTHHDPGKKLMRSLCYFLTFGSYEGYQPGRADFGHYSGSGMREFVGLHWRTYTLWLGALLGTPILFLVARRRTKEEEHVVAHQAGNFIPWFYVTLTASFILTLIWGIKQDGPMYYFNAYFNYSIYFCLALGLASALARVLMAWTRSPKMGRLRLVVAAFLWISVAGAAVYRSKNFRSNDAFGAPEDQLAASTVERAMVGLPKEAVYFLDCHPWTNWPITIAVALELERLGHPFRVNDNWGIMFGSNHTVRQGGIGATTPLVRWIVVPQSENPDRLKQWPLPGGSALDARNLSEVSPDGQRISFSKDGNFNDFAFFGWSPSDGTWTWSDQQTAMLAFRPLPVLGNAGQGVEMLISAWSFSPPDKADRQRAMIELNGVALGTVYLPINDADIQPVHVWISAAQWHDAVTKGTARLQFDFPDAKSPASVGLGADARLLGGGFRSIEFRAAR